MTYIPVDVIVDQKGKQRHQIDTLNLLAYVVLLVLVLVTAWYFKRRKRLCIHETGLAIIYGLLMGAALRYFGLEVKITAATLGDVLPYNAPIYDYITVKAGADISMNQTHEPHVYVYEFRGEVQSTAKLGSQISYASVEPEVFFNIILPPIVLNAGLSLKRRHFFRNIGAIFSYAFIGTSISVAFVGSFIYGAINLLKLISNYSYLADQFSLANCFYFGAIISPTDPIAVLSIFQELGVDVNLFALVFGESILNDAVSIVLTHSIDQFSIIYGRDSTYPISSLLWKCVYNFVNMFITSCWIGILFGIVTSITTKFIKLTETPLLETCIIVLMSYSSFLTAEVVDSSGIVAILLCGITQAHYTINNLSFEARERIKNLFELLTFLCENFLFLAVGVSFWQRGQAWNLSFIGIAFVAVILARVISIYPLTGLLNLGRRTKIPCNFQHLITWGGAARGVISYSLAARNTVGAARRIMLSTTSVIVIFSVIVVGGTVDKMLKCLKIPFNGDDETKLDYTNDAQGLAITKANLDPEQQNREIMATNNPNWSLKPKPFNRSSNNYLDAKLCSRFNHQKHCNQSSLNVTPILEIETAWNQRGCSQTTANTSIGTLDSAPAEASAKTVKGATNESDLVIDQRTLEEIEVDENQKGVVGCRTSVLDNDSLVNTNNNNNNNNNNSHSSTDNLQENGANSDSGSPYENANLVRLWRHVDNNYIKPLLTNSYPTLMETLPKPLKGLAKFFTSDEQMMRRPRN